MLVTNQRLDKLAAARVDFINWGMLPPSYGPPPAPMEPAPNNDEREDDAEPTDEPYVTGNVVLARTRGEFLSTFWTSHFDISSSPKVSLSPPGTH